MFARTGFALVSAVLSILPLGTFASAQEAEYKLPDNVIVREVTIWSEGSRMKGDLYLPKGLNSGEKRPAIVMSHGWGGTKARLQPAAAKFASGGYITLAFTYRGFGGSEGEMVLLDGMSELDDNNNATVKVHMIRDVVDPMDRAQDFRAAVDFVEGEAHVDTSRIGAWGTSYGGAIVFWNAAEDERLRVVVSQVGAMFSPDRDLQLSSESKLRAIQAAREGPDSVYQDKIEGLRGWPNRANMVTFDPVSRAKEINVPTLLIDAENESLFNLADGSKRAFEIIRSNGSTPVRYEVIPEIKHWDIYTTGFKQSTDLALEWFGQHL